MTTNGEGRWPTIQAMTSAAAEQFGDGLAVSDGATTITYSGLFEAARSFGAALVASGVDRGDRVALWAFNSAEWIVACLGLFQAGAVLVPVNTRFKGPEAAEILSRSGARVLVTVTDFLGADYVKMLRSASAGLAELPELKTIIVAHGGVPEGAESWQDFVARATAGAMAEAGRRQAAAGTGDMSDILFTSGTTGAPKGVVMTHGRTLHCATDWVAMTGLGPADRYLMINPYFSQFGYKAGILACVAAGAAMLPEAVLDVDRVLNRVQQERVTVLPGPPTLYQSILDHPQLDRYDLSSLRVAVTGSADIPVELIGRIHEELPFSTIISGYGMTEGGTAASTGPGDGFAAIATTVGRARPGFEIRIVDEQGNDVPGGEIGEIVFRGRSVMRSYLDDPEGTAAALSADGWLRSGDLGTFDDQGRLRIVGRLKDMFIVGGFNVYPAEVENALLRHPDIRRAAVIGIPDRRLGEVGMAFAVLKPEAAATAGKDIISWCREQMANYKVPRVVEILSELPLNASGKVEKGALRARAASRGVRGVAPPASQQSLRQPIMTVMSSIEAIGFVGLGVMGGAMCRNLVRQSGLPVTVYDVAEAAVERLTADGARAASSPAGVAADVVFCSLPGHLQLEEVLTGAGGVIAALAGRSGRPPVIVDLGTSSVESTRRIASLASRSGIAYCDAPVARTRQAAIDGTLAVMVGGDRGVVEHIRPLLLCLATDVTYCGPAGSGQIVKQLNNMVLFQNVLAIAEAHAIATAAGLDGTLLFDALSKGSADSFALRNHGMKAIIADEYPLNAFSTDYALKDLGYALELASATGVAARGAELVRRVLEATREMGWGSQYFPALRRTIGSARGTVNSGDADSR